jgi:hypothetical protein
MDLAAVAKPHFDLGRMHVHIHPHRIHIKVNRVDRLALAVQHVFEGAAHPVHDDLVAHKAAIDVGVLMVGPGAGMVGQADPAVHPHRTHGAVQSHRLGEELLAQDIGEAAIEGIFAPVWAPLLGQFAVVPDVKADIGSRQRMAPHRLQAMGEFRGGAL